MYDSADIYQIIEDECRKAINNIPSSHEKVKLKVGNARNMLTALKHVKRLDRIEDLLCPDKTEILVGALADDLRSQGKAKGTVKSTTTNTRRLSELTQIMYESAKQPSDLPDITRLPLREALNAILKTCYPNRSKISVVRELGVSVANMLQPENYPEPSHLLKADCKTLDGRIAYCTTKIENFTSSNQKPIASGKPFLSLLERALLLEKGTLAHKASHALPEARLNKKEKAKKRKKEAKASFEELSDDEKEEYLFIKEKMAGFELPSHVEKQLAVLTTYRTGGRAPTRSKATFPVTKKDEVAMKHTLWSKDGFGVSATAEIFKGDLKYYMRWLHVNHGVPLADLDLSLLLHDEVLELFVDYCITKGGSSSAHHLIAAIAAMAKPNVGYLSRHHVPVKPFSFTSEEMQDISDSGGLLLFSNLEEWQLNETKLYSKLTSLSVDAKDAATNREGDRGVLWVIEHADGIEAGIDDLWKAIDDLVLDSQITANHRRKYSPACAAAWLALELRTPLRIKNTAELELLKEPPMLREKPKNPSFWLDTDGHYNVFVPKRFLKNGRKKKSSGKDTITDVNAKIKEGTRIHGVLKHYLQVRSDALKVEGCTSDYLFFTAKARLTFGEKIDRAVLGALIVRHMESACGRVLDVKKLGIIYNFNPHGMRHIVAQRILAKEPDNYRKAATALMDSVGTIMKIYGSNKHATNENELDDECD